MVEFDFTQIAKFGLLEWFKRKDALKMFGVVFVYLLIINIITFYAMYGLMKPVADLSAASADVIIDTAANFILFMGFIGIISLVFGVLISYFVISKALQSAKKSFVKLNFQKWLSLIALEILNTLAVIFSIFKLKFLLVGAAGIVLFIISIALVATVGAIYGAVVLIIAILLLLAYLVIIIYNAIRLSMSCVMFIEKERGVIESLRSSWDLTAKKEFNILIGFVLISIIAMIISMIGTIPLMGYDIVTQLGGGTSSQDIAVLMNPLFLLFNVPSMITSAIATIVASFGMVGIYSQLTGKSEKTTAKKAVKKKARK